jgi:hypothetical protein
MIHVVFVIPGSREASACESNDELRYQGIAHVNDSLEPHISNDQGASGI